MSKMLLQKGSRHEFQRDIFIEFYALCKMQQKKKRFTGMFADEINSKIKKKVEKQ